MSWPTPGGEPPPNPNGSTPAATLPEPDAETARVPVVPAPPLVPDSPPPPPTGIISASPVGLPGIGQSATDRPPDAPVSGWVTPSVQPRPQVAEGLVIAGVFARLVAYSIDGLFLGSVNLAIFGLLGLYSVDRDETVALAVSIVLVGIDLLYFVGLWTSGWQGTIGMRLLRLRVLGASSAGTLSVNDALLRWLALSGALSILALVPGVGRYIGLLDIAWFFALLFTAVGSPLRQGLHDRWARSIVAQPAPGGSGAALIGCLILVVIVVVVLPIGILAIAGDQIRDLLIKVGESVR